MPTTFQFNAAQLAEIENRLDLVASPHLKVHCADLP